MLSIGGSGTPLLFGRGIRPRPVVRVVEVGEIRPRIVLARVEAGGRRAVERTGARSRAAEVVRVRAPAQALRLDRVTEVLDAEVRGAGRRAIVVRDAERARGPEWPVVRL